MYNKLWNFLMFNYIFRPDPKANPKAKQAASKLMKPLLDAGLVRRVGSQKFGRYIQS